MKLIKKNPDNSLLNPISRETGRNRMGWNSANIPFRGIDIWNCYEFSFLLENGKPLSEILRIEYPATSPNIIESKSLKLYLNSFNMVKFRDNQTAISVVNNDLSEKLASNDVILSTINAENFSGEFTDSTQFQNLDNMKINDKIDYKYNPGLLTAESNSMYEYFFKTNLLKSNCPLTGQPDWATVYIYYKAKKKLNPTSFLRYIISYRTLGEYHEECCERILHDLQEILQPKELVVFCKYTRRGGIDINPLRVYTTRKNYLDIMPQRFKKIIYTRDFRQ